MAPPPATASAAAGDPAEAEPLEVRCAGCGETLEVDRGLTEFICPDCATPQSLPPELMPPPPPRRKALPLPRGAADVRGARLPCGSCGALLSVPVGLPRCACPLCGAELAVDTARLRHYLLSSAAAADAVPVVPLGTSSAAPPILQALEAQTERPSRLIPEQAESGHPDYTIDEAGVHGVNEVTTRYKEQRNLYSGDPRIVSAENRQGAALNQGRHQGQDLPSSYSVHTKQTYQEHPDRVIEAPQDSVNSELFRESGCIAHINDTTSTDINGTTGRSIKPKTVAVEKRNMQAPKYITHKSQKKLSSYVISPERAQAESANGAIRVQEKQPEPVKEANHTEEACTQLVNETNADDNARRRTRRLISLNAMGVEKRQGQTTNEATQELRKEQSDSVIRMALNNKITHVEKEQSGRHRVNKMKRKGLIAASNSGLQLRRSKRLAKDSSAAVDKQPVIGTEPTHRETVGCQAAASSDHTPAAITADELTESEPDELPAASPVQNSSDPPDIDRIINNLCTSSSPRHEIPQTSSNEFENLHSTVLISSSNPDMSDPEHFARAYIPLDVRRALAKLGSKSLLHRMMSQTSSDEAYLLQLASQNNGQHGGRGLTLCLKVWTLPRGVRIPVSLNTSGEPIGKEAATLSAFLGALARDGILSPLVYHDWRCVPEKNKDVMCHIAKLKFDIAPVGELWIVKNLGKKWKSWKALLKQKHFDTHETEEERLADRNPRVLEEQWRFLVAYWSTEKAKAASARNKACQSKITTRHTSGTKSFARIIEEERQKRPNKNEPTPEDLFILTHTPKDGKPMNKVAADAIARFRELSQKQTEGSGSDSTAHSFGLGSYPNGPRGKAALKESLREAMEAKKRAEDEAATLRKKMIAMEESQRKLQDTANMKSAGSHMNKSITNKHVRNMVPISDFPEEVTGEPSASPGFPQVQNAPSSVETLEPYLDLPPLYNSSASYDQRFR